MSQWSFDILRQTGWDWWVVICTLAAMKALSSLEADLHQHIHMENNIMFRQAVEPEAKLRGE